MSNDNTRKLSLELTLHSTLLPVVTSLTEKASLAFGMEKRDALRLTLAVEEVFSYLAQKSRHNEMISLHCLDGRYYIEIKFIFPLKDLNLRAFNLTSTVSPEDEAQWEEMGLLLASRQVDRLQLFPVNNRNMCLSLSKDKSYPKAGGERPVLQEDLQDFFISVPGAEDIKQFCRGIIANYESYFYPPFILLPGKLVDMVSSGEYHAALAYNKKKQVMGGIIWSEQQEKTVECFGPYAFTVNPEMTAKLLEHCLEQVGRSRAPGLLNRCIRPGSLAEGYFEKLGATVFHQPEGRTREKTAFYRQLGEDLGDRVWVHPMLTEFLTEEYRRLYLPRDIRELKEMGEQNHAHDLAHSVFSCEFAPKEVTLRPLLGGADAALNLEQHLQLFAQEDIKNIFFELDLGEEWPGRLVPALLENKFYPCLILPYAGKGDILLFQHRAGEKR